MRQLIAAICLVTLAVACGNSPDEASDLADPTPSATSTGASSDATKPEIEIPEGEPPEELVIEDIKKGKGDKVEEGATVTVNYVGVSWSTGEEFDSSWEREPATFPLANVIKGWQDGIPGMRVGGQRKLTIPPDLAYGAEGRPGIAPNETLVFVIDLLAIG